MGIVGNIKGPAGSSDNVAILAANFSRTVVAEAAVTGWTFAVTGGKAYLVEVIATYQSAATTTGGELGFFLSDGATGTIHGYAEGSIGQAVLATSLRQTIRAIGAADLAGSNMITTGVSLINSPHEITAKVVFHCTVGGTFNVGWATEVAASASQLNAGSLLLWRQLN